MPRITSTPKVNFNLDIQKGRGYIVLIYRYQFRGERIKLKYFTGEFVEPKYWERKKQRAKFTRNRPEYVDLNKKLNDLDSIVNQIYKDTARGNISPEDFKNEIAYRIGDKLRPEDDKSHIPNFFQFIDQYIAEQQAKADSKRNTWKKYITVRSHLQDYANERNLDLDYNSIDWKFRNDFVNWLYAPPRNHAINTASKVMGVVKLFMEESKKLKYHDNDTYSDKGFRVRTVMTKNKVRLSLEELDALLSLDLSDNERLEKVRDLFIVGAFSGLRFSDWHKIGKEQIFISDGIELIKVRAQKTGKYTAIPLLPELKQVLEKYNYALPTISSQKFNDYIKEVCQLALGNVTFMRIYSEAGRTKDETIEKWQKVSSHAARRSFVSNFLQLEVSPTLIRAITGHATEKQLYEYADIEADELAATFTKKAGAALEEHRKKVKRI
ncbi:MAG TPA: phage integrase SAM-like domain-containing protein [Saprospiraceae bacterium]|nr:phage integrase SAM-like domain-containing protein [Saprospiraceae bacterium]HMP24316.1 phage integrase SAM-like domain-containing protein [Saprospiraceae bacterium]